MSSIFTRSNMNSVKFELKKYCFERNIYMGIDESDDRPYVVRYVFQREGCGNYYIIWSVITG